MGKFPEFLKLIFFQFLKIGKSCCRNNRLVNIISVIDKILEEIMTLMIFLLSLKIRYMKIEAIRMSF